MLVHEILCHPSFLPISRTFPWGELQRLPNKGRSNGFSLLSDTLELLTSSQSGTEGYAIGKMSKGESVTWTR